MTYILPRTLRIVLDALAALFVVWTVLATVLFVQATPDGRGTIVTIYSWIAFGLGLVFIGLGVLFHVINHPRPYWYIQLGIIAMGLSVLAFAIVQTGTTVATIAVLLSIVFVALLISFFRASRA